MLRHSSRVAVVKILFGYIGLPLWLLTALIGILFTPLLLLSGVILVLIVGLGLLAHAAIEFTARVKIKRGICPECGSGGDIPNEESVFKCRLCGAAFRADGHLIERQP